MGGGRPLNSAAMQCSIRVAFAWIHRLTITDRHYVHENETSAQRDAQSTHSCAGKQQKERERELACAHGRTCDSPVRTET